MREGEKRDGWEERRGGTGEGGGGRGWEKERGRRRRKEEIIRKLSEDIKV